MDKHMFVYRVEVTGVGDKEHANIGAGVYAGALPDYAPQCSLSSILDAFHKSGSEEVQPLPHQDEGINAYMHEEKWDTNHNSVRFAFQSVNAYRRWFHNARGRQDAVMWGVLTKYRVPVCDVLVGTCQCLVIASSMEAVDRISLDTREVTL